VEAVGRDRGGVHEPPSSGGRGGAEGIEGALDVDRPGGGLVAPDDEEGEVYDDVRAGEGIAQGVGISDVTAAVLHLRPALLGRVEGSARHSHHLRDAAVGLQQGQESVAEGPGGAGHGNGQVRLYRHALLIPGPRGLMP
jgi:hypothetical protein